MDRAPPPMTPVRAISRRTLLRRASAAGGALVVGVSLPRDGGAAPPRKAFGPVFAPDAFIRIAPDDSVTLVMSQVEMGQGIYTAIATLIAEELDIELRRVTLEAAPANDRLYANPAFRIQMTGGSTSMRAYWMPMRKAGASARAMLVAAAAARWKVDPLSCRTEAGVVWHDPSHRSVRYGALVAEAAKLPRPAAPVLKDPKAFRLIGRPLRRLDTPAKTDGSLRYGIDAMPPGVRFATLAASPVFGGKVRHVDDRQALAVPGVRQVVVLDDLVAVVGDHMWAAKQGLDALVIDWDEGPHAGVTSADLWTALGKAADGEGLVVQAIGDAPKAMQGQPLVEAHYELPFLAHAAMEPMNCTVEVRPDACEIWVGTQVMTKAQAIAAQASGLRPDQVTIHNHLIGGGFGRRLEVDGIGKAVRIARRVTGPVKVVWTREEDIRQELYRPIYHNRMSARLAGDKLVAWKHRVVGPAIMARFLPAAFTKGIDVDAVDGAIDLPYDIPHQRIEYLRHEPAGVPTAFWRGVGPNSTIFAAECFMDRLARAAHADPIAFRRGLLGKSPRARAVLDLAAGKAGWGRPLPARAARGVCLMAAFGSFLAAVAEVEVAEDGEVRVQRLVCAVDCGHVTNPDTVRAQIQGGMIFGLTAVLHGDITVDRGRVQQGNFNDYRLLRIDEIPAIEVHLVPSGETPGGIGEPGTVVVQPAVANAVYAATGVQLARMPIDRRKIARGHA